MSSGEEKAGSGAEWSDSGPDTPAEAAADESALFGNLSSSPSADEGKVDNVTSQDLFGDADDISSDSADEGQENESDGVPSVQVKSDAAPKASLHRATMVDDDEDVGDFGTGFDVDGEQEGLSGFPGFPDDDEEDVEPEPEPVTSVIEADMPIFPSMMNEQLFFVKMPNFLSVEPRAFDPEFYDEEVDEEELQDEEGRSRLKLKIENTIRWRYAKDSAGDGENEEGRERESNARIVRWSDGSASLMLGSEVFDIHQNALGSGDFSHLFVQQGTGLQGQAVFKTKLTFRPHSTDSHTHRKITMSIADRLGKTQKIRVLPVVGKDPDAHRTEMMKKEEDRLRSAVRLENQQRRMRERQYAKGKVNVGFLENFGDDDDDDETSISAIKRSVHNRAPKPQRRTPIKKKRPKPKARRDGESSDEEDEEEDDGDGYDDGDGFINDGDEESDDEGEEDEDEAQSTSEEEEVPVVEKAQKRKAPAPAAEVPTSKRKKQIRSKHMISSSEDESD